MENISDNKKLNFKYIKEEDIQLLHDFLQKKYIDLIQYAGEKTNVIDLVGCNTLFRVDHLCNENSIMKWAYNNKFVPIGSNINWDREVISNQELRCFLGQLTSMYSSSIRLIELSQKHIKQTKNKQFFCTPSSEDFKVVINYAMYMPIIQSETVGLVLGDLKSMFIKLIGENYVDREKVAEDILSTIKLNSWNIDSLKHLKSELISYIIEYSDVPDFSRAFLYAQHLDYDNNIVQLEDKLIDDINDILSTVKFDIKEIDLLKKLQENVNSFIKQDESSLVLSKK